MDAKDKKAAARILRDVQKYPRHTQRTDRWEYRKQVDIDLAEILERKIEKDEPTIIPVECRFVCEPADPEVGIMGRSIIYAQFEVDAEELLSEDMLELLNDELVDDAEAVDRGD